MLKISPKKHLGQNFLKDEKIAQKIVDSIDLADKNLVEIGPGTGFLTKYLVQKAKFLTCYEIDKNLIPLLENKFKNKNIKIINEDFLLSDLNFSEKQTVIGNLPYCITSKILFKIFDNFEKFDEILIMVQNEVADRIIATPGTASYSKLSLACQYVAEVKKFFVVPPSSFFPVPKVDSAIVYFSIRKNLNSEKVAQFFKFTKLCFQFKRKTLYNNLKNSLSQDEIEKIFNFFNFDQKIRPQEINVETYARISNFYFDNSKNK
ncbi:16S rRNA (adenine(1518)-N(6)/adenine(1519)-N(6))-dimethyltransferase RsmA [Mesomycoplasma ovipneumoniae]|uniref:16S rRNA (adenine(1518)-N(6)/adenine(1519)-N(6))- dimethyltransferase RsmA n=1 Tax=Mesomycoplasma ovipneumoniae TaxID=29562 RepID=UPI0028B108CF|nr:16S rRNA (adenine(1518)-N(6)/adenine(1519)-N(6))-dimethyltransferase RsmA [Mesomycoplasma ovipneumoniae]MDW2933629.1 16S rRNA (adenine(1518)-N(6)/adenine(1519)-N(6))-dimethyltransferase RsmA [Mesomycoplasma ovipneumoniae]WNM15969.1 16S rRNA (adenine(1518)-N(6)/adenine(1519)-N(6))-dimethyltransferase RsmA [Mesomycoplasma ovipneumoniae]